MSKGQPGPEAAQPVFAGAKGGSSLGRGGGEECLGGAPRGPCENAEADLLWSLESRSRGESSVSTMFAIET